MKAFSFVSMSLVPHYRLANKKLWYGTWEVKTDFFILNNRFPGNSLESSLGSSKFKFRIFNVGFRQRSFSGNLYQIGSFQEILTTVEYRLVNVHFLQNLESYKNCYRYDITKRKKMYIFSQVTSGMRE